MNESSAILIYTREPNMEILKEIMYGIEEEGVRFVVKLHAENPVSLAEQAANDSTLGCGIGCNGNEAVLAVSNAGSILHTHGVAREQYRKLGQNAGRYVKKLPLNFVCTDS